MGHAQPRAGHKAAGALVTRAHPELLPAAGSHARMVPSGPTSGLITQCSSSSSSSSAIKTWLSVPIPPAVTALPDPHCYMRPDDALEPQAFTYGRYVLCRIHTGSCGRFILCWYGLAPMVKVCVGVLLCLLRTCGAAVLLPCDLA